MPTVASHTSPHNQALYRATLQEAAAGGNMLMGKLVAVARSALQVREAACRELRERDALAQSAKQLRLWESELCKRYPPALLEAFGSAQEAKRTDALAITDVGFDQLELMDEVQVLTSVTLARVHQVAMMAAEVSLAELNTLICSILGLGAVHAERNPLRPQIYINALKTVFGQTQLPAEVQLDWLGTMADTLGSELRNTYGQLCASLRGQGVVSAGYMVVQAAGVGGVGRGVAQEFLQDHLQAVASTLPAAVERPSPVAPPIPVAPASPVAGSSAALPRATDDTLLTLDKLRRLLAGELEPRKPQTAMEQFAQRFASEFENGNLGKDAPVTGFDSTVPAALEALKEMQQVDEVVQRIQQRWAGAAQTVEAGDTSIQALRSQLRSQSRGLGQSLSLEVVTLMVDNIARDSRLLEPVQKLMRTLEPPLLRLALVDPRLFTNKQHPARLLVQEVAERSLAYAYERSPGFTEFVLAIDQAFSLLREAPIEDAEPFEQVLAVLQDEWRQVARKGNRGRKEAMHALQQAEQRNQLAQKIALDIAALPQAARAPTDVVEFLCGPWAQVLAQARLDGAAAAGAAESYLALVSDLLWSTDPDLSRVDAQKLTRLVPPLLGTLREGLEKIRYPATKTSIFFEVLMGLHQRAFRAGQKPRTVAGAAKVPLAAAKQAQLADDGNPWVAPEEARASNFIDLTEPAADAETPVAGAPTPGEADPAAMVARRPDHTDAIPLPLGCWVELWVDGQWVRTQLTWVSPHATLFLFTAASGATQSMTRRTRDKLLADGQLRVISGQPVVEGALNAVAQMAMRNSIKGLS